MLVQFVSLCVVLLCFKDHLLLLYSVVIYEIYLVVRVICIISYIFVSKQVMLGYCAGLH